MKDSDYDFKSTILGNAKMENLSLAQLDENTIELQWSNLQMEDRCIGGYIVELKSKTQKLQTKFYEQSDVTVRYFVVSGGGSSLHCV